MLDYLWKQYAAGYNHLLGYVNPAFKVSLQCMHASYSQYYPSTFSVDGMPDLAGQTAIVTGGKPFFIQLNNDDIGIC